jgi:dienelactone hydrolase
MSRRAADDPVATRNSEGEVIGMRLRERSTADGVVAQLFDVDVDGNRVPGVLWLPDGVAGPLPLVLMGHGGTQHKTVATMVSRARRYAGKLGLAVAAIDAPDHGDRVTPEQAQTYAEQLRARIAGGGRFTPELARRMAERAHQAVREWQVTLDALQELDIIGTAGPVGYWGLSMGTAIGVPLVAAEPRITAAVLGLGGLQPENEALGKAAEAIKIPVEFVLQWDDEVVARDTGFTLFGALGTRDKTLHVNPGRHVEVPHAERDSWERFFTRHLRTPTP